MKIYLIALLTVIVSVSSCDDGDRVEFGNHRYLPLEIGNYWEFVADNSQDGSIVEHREVVRKETIGDHVYYLVVSTWPVYSSRSSDSIYYRVTSNGYVYKLYKGGAREFQDLRLDANDGETWSYTYLNYEAVITCSKVEVELDTTSIDDCKSYFRDVTEMADEEYTIVLARQIGFVREYSNAWGTGNRLKKARIGGVLRSF